MSLGQAETMRAEARVQAAAFSALDEAIARNGQRERERRGTASGRWNIPDSRREAARVRTALIKNARTSGFRSEDSARARASFPLASPAKCLAKHHRVRGEGGEGVEKPLAVSGALARGLTSPRFRGIHPRIEE